VILLRVAYLFAVSSAALLTVSTAYAGPTTPSDLMNSYNLIVFGNLTNNSQHVDGKTYVGGNVSGSGDYNQKPVGVNLPALTVGGNFSGSANINGTGGIAVTGNFASQNYYNQNGLGTSYIGGNLTGNANFKGDLYVGGNISGNVNVNDGTKHQNFGLGSIASHLTSPATTTAMQNTLGGYSSWLDTLTATSTITQNGMLATFNATPNANGVAVFDINNAIDFFNSINEIRFNVGSATEIVVNVSGASSGLLTIAENFLDGIAPSLGLNTIWNFTDATDIHIDRQFGGSILALLADVRLATVPMRKGRSLPRTPRSMPRFTTTA